MRKRNLLFISFLLAASLTACGKTKLVESNNGAETIAEAVTSAEAENTYEAENTAETAATDAELIAGTESLGAVSETRSITTTAYDDLILRFSLLADDPHSFSLTDTDGSGEMNYLITATEMEDNYGGKASDMTGYALKDLNYDGIPELAIGTVNEYGAFLTDLFTLVNGKPHMVFGEFGENYARVKNGSFFYDDYHSASEYGKGIYYFNNDGTALVCNEFYFIRALDGDDADAIVYYNMSGSWEIEDSTESSVSVDDFYAWKPEYDYLPIIPFSAAD